VLLSLQVKLSKNLAREARAKGLLEPLALEKMLVAELRRSRGDQLFEAANRLAALDLPPMAPDELEKEIKSVQSRRREVNAGRR
jgi:hypothetical protein